MGGSGRGRLDPRTALLDLVDCVFALLACCFHIWELGLLLLV
jgi:hypothetical protein